MARTNSDYATVIQEDFSAGIQRDVAPHLIDPRGVFDCVNGLYDDDGSIYRRGGAAYLSGAFGTSATGRVNLVTNPSFEVGTTGWNQDAASGSIARVADVTAPTGSYIGRQTNPGTNAGEGVAIGYSGATIGLNYTGAMWVKATVGTPLILQLYDGVTAPQTYWTASGLWEKKTVTITAGATTGSFYVYTNPSAGAVASTIDIDAAQLIQESTASIYFDGSTGNAQWNGTANASTSTELLGTGLTFIFDGYLDPGRRTVVANSSDFGVLSSDDATVGNLGGAGLSEPAVSCLLNGHMFIGGGGMYGGSRKTSTYSTGTVSITSGTKTVTGVGTSFTANVDAGMLFQHGNERTYVVASVTDNTHLVLRDNYEGTTLAGATYTASPLYTVTTADPYETMTAPWVCANRLVWGVGNLVKFSPIDSPHSVSATDFHELPEGAQVLGGAAVGDTSLIFTTEGVWTLSGLPFEIVDPATGNPQHRLKLLSRDIILANPTGIAGWQQALVVPATDGIYLMDGVSSPEKLSKPVDDLYIPYIDQGLRPGQAVVHRRHYILPIIDTNAVVHDTLVCRLDRPVKSRGQVTFPWSRLADVGANSPAYAVRIGSTTPEPLLLAAEGNTTSRAIDCSAFFSPSSSYKADQDGTAHAFDVITRDYETGNKTKNVIRRVRPRFEGADADADDPELDILYGLGATDPTLPYWGASDGLWGSGFGPGGDQPWTDSSEANFTTACTLGEDPAGTEAHRCRIGKSSRYIRYRVRSSDPWADLNLRALETFIRPSGSVMR